MRGIFSEKINLAPVEKTDSDRIHSWKNDSELLGLLKSHQIFSTQKDVENWIDRNSADRNQVLMGIFTDNEIIGIIRLMFIDWISRTAELGVYIGEKNKRSSGFGGEAVQLIIKYAFTHLNLRKISLKVLSDNKKAADLYLRLGFTQEGILKKHFWANGQYNDVLLMALFEGDTKSV